MRSKIMLLILAATMCGAGCDHSGDYRPSTPRQRALEVTQRTEASIKKIQADPGMSEQAKQIVIGQLRRSEQASSAGSAATGASKRQSP